MKPVRPTPAQRAFLGGLARGGTCTRVVGSYALIGGDVRPGLNTLTRWVNPATAEAAERHGWVEIRGLGVYLTPAGAEELRRMIDERTGD